MLASSVLLPTTKEWECSLLQRSTAKVISEGLHGYLCKPLWSESDAEKHSKINTHSYYALILGVLKRPCREVIKDDGVLQPAAGEAEDEDNDFPWDSEVPSLRQTVEVPLTHLLHFPLLLLLPHVHNLHLDMLLLQMCCSVGTGTK